MNTKKIYPKWFIAPAGIVYTVLFILPCIVGFYAAMTNWNNFSDKIKFIGFDNFREIFVDDSSYYLLLLRNTVYFTAVTAVLEIVVGLSLALCLNMRLRTKAALRSIFFAPFAISPYIIGIMFIAILKPEGLFNSVLTAVGLKNLTRSWLTDFKMALPSVSFVEIWRYAGANMVIFLAGLQTIDPTFYEAADVEGANPLQKFIYVTVPYIMPAMTINLVLNTVHGFRVFDIIFALTNGGPGSATEVLNTAVFRTFSKGNKGLSAAMNLVVLFITTSVSLTIRKLTSRGEVESI